MSSHIVKPTRITVYELCKNNESIFQDFFDEIIKDINLFSDLARAIRVVEDTSNLIRYPQTKFRQLENVSKNFKVYEAKAGSIRIYLFQDIVGRVIIAGGKKGDQITDIKRLSIILKDYHYENKK